MNLLQRLSGLLRISGSQGIMRRYVVVNGFDGALTMLGIILGFHLSHPTGLSTVITACLGAAIALGVSGISSAYVSEKAERRRALTKLEESMIRDLGESFHGEAARRVPFVIALANGLAPLVICLLIMAPLWIARAGLPLPLPPLHAAILVALSLIFLLGVYLGRVQGVSWFLSGLETLLVALGTALLIYLFAAG